VNSSEVNTVTLEDPVEHVIEGVNQMQVNVAAGLTFGTGLRSIVRQDPDIVMVGEIRDLETADLAINAALTGHLVFSTLHTNSSASGITRLIDIGVEPFLVASTVNVIVAQRLVRRICDDCREKVSPSESVLELLQTTLPFMFNGSSSQRDVMLAAYSNISPNLEERSLQLSRGRGCNLCRGTGYRGRIGIFEVLQMSNTIMDLTVRKSSEKDIEEVAVREGMITLIQEGMLKVLDGQTTVEEVLRVSA
jgi:type II secretory ATPase GspE/PulE/Tfp pilus assembly ATPase PilB-like protein